MRVVQFEIPGEGRRVGVIDGDSVRDVTSVRPDLVRVYDVFAAAQQAGRSFDEFLTEVARSENVATISYKSLHEGSPGDDRPFLHPPLDHADPHFVLIAGTGLTHTGSMQSRDEMHTSDQAEVAKPKTDSAKMFDLGLDGGKPSAGTRGAAPEWFYKGSGTNLRGHRWPLEKPAFALDGGEEPELVGCYIIDDTGTPRRLGFALGNEWSDHATEKINYLYLAPSKLRTCAVGPELVTDFDFSRLSLRCTVGRNGETIYDSGGLYSGEEFMCHSLANCEDHHFKYPQHRQPGDVHLHYFGTSKLSHTSRDWKYQPGDEITVTAENFGAPLVNNVEAGDPILTQPITVKPA